MCLTFDKVHANKKNLDYSQYFFLFKVYNNIYYKSASTNVIFLKH